jgi:type IV pilus assembly protein PilN
MRFTINLATRKHLNHDLVNRCLAAVLLLLLLVTGWKLKQFVGNRGELERLNSGIAALQARLNSRPSSVSEQEFDRRRKNIRFFNDIIERKACGWLELLDRLESVTPRQIALTSLAPDPKSGTLKIEGVARNFGQVRSYLERLEDSKVFGDILLLSHAEQAVGEKGRALRFGISCRMVKP